MVSGSLDADIWEAVDAAATKPFGFMPFYPGPGVGGHCLPIDPCYLSWQVKRLLRQDVRTIQLANEINGTMPDHVVTRISRGLNARGKPVNGSRILQLGVAYKKNTGDTREPRGRRGGGRHRPRRLRLRARRAGRGVRVRHPQPLPPR
jgi:UDP-N-acetyl-D-mannosaminuronate dehydrogenase